ncbi:BTAD domain-containing putative transcriptional regulator [Kitasatospora sp. NPDC088346]|uniref:AfsR/SARP family transcriptional regulator n=1 Tax=Kitasatospora sp. NPDC088346 TaxID=3364073 RepID=UPI0038100B2B
MTCDNSGASHRTPGTDLQLLGTWRLSLGGRAIELQPTARRILTLLALRGPVTRTALSCTLWPDVDEPAAAGRLRTALWRLSPSGRLVHARGEVLALDASVLVDVRRMLSAARALRNREPAVQPPVELFEQDLLPDWQEDWLVVERERVRQCRLHALESLSDLMRREARYAEAVDVALAAVNAEPLRESSHRAVISAHLAEGNVAEALRQFETCRRVLHDQLGVEPSTALSALLPSRPRTPGAPRVTPLPLPRPVSAVVP